MNPVPNRSDPPAGSGLASLDRREPQVELSAGVLRAVLASVLDPTITIDDHGRILHASDSVKDMFGWTAAELEGQNIRMLLPEPHHSQHDQYLANYRRTGITHILGRTREFQVLRKDGELIECELSIARTDPPGAALPVFTGSFRDICARKRAERALRDSERRFHAIFDQSFQYVGLLAPDGTLLEANRAALASGGLVREDVIGKPFWETYWWTVDEAAAQSCKDAVARAAAGEFVRFQTRHRGQAGEVLSIDFSLTPVRDENGEIVLLIPEGRDTTEIERAQRAETQMLRAMATIGESAAVLAHEIKNPITAVNVALRAVADQLGQDHRMILEDLSSRMMRLERMLRRTLSFVKPITVRSTPVDLIGVIQASVRLLRPLIVKSGVDVRTRLPEEPLVLRGDGGLLEEVVTNVIANAIEVFEGRAGGGVVEVRLDRLPSGSASIVVEDSGPGIPDSLRHTLFQPYVTTKARGTGLGLAFCKKVIEEHQGTIAAGNSPLGGARFEVILPASATKDPRKAPS